MTETINFSIDSEDLKEFKETTGMNLADCIKILINSVKYGGKLEFYTFWSDENFAELKRRIDDLKQGKNVVKFTAEEWEKFLKENYAGCESVRIDKKNRLIFRINNGMIEIAECGEHYDDK